MLLYKLVGLKYKKLYLLLISYGFYALWDYRFLVLIFISTLTDFICANKIHKGVNKQKYLFISLFINLGLLCIFKYFDFFIENFNTLIELLGLSLSLPLLELIFPLGISFYTFQTLSYTFDVYRGKQTPTKDFVLFGLYVAYFPQLVAGPIERAKKLMPQLESLGSIKKIEYEKSFYLIFWGLFKKLAIADNLGLLVNNVFENTQSYDLFSIYLASFAFAIQLYCDFSAYSNIARGVSLLFGIELSVNFKFPLLAKNANDFWKSWHITLMSWIRDYFLLFLKKNRVTQNKKYLHILIIFSFMGFWHGAGWNFILFGIYSGLGLISNLMWRKSNIYKVLVNKSVIYKVCHEYVHFLLLPLGFFLFRIESMEMLKIILEKDLLDISLFSMENIHILKYITLFSSLLYYVEIQAKKNQDNFYLLHFLGIKKITIFTVLTLFFIIFGNLGNYQFIYFRF